MLVCGRSVFRVRVEIHESDRVIRERGSPVQSTDFNCFLIEFLGCQFSMRSRLRFRV